MNPRRTISEIITSCIPRKPAWYWLLHPIQFGPYAEQLLSYMATGERISKGDEAMIL